MISHIFLYGFSQYKSLRRFIFENYITDEAKKVKKIEICYLCLLHITVNCW